MEPATNRVEPLAASLKRFACRLLTIGENRLELLTVEVQEEREHLLHAFLLGLGMAAFGLLAAVTLTTAIVVWLWSLLTHGRSPDTERPLRCGGSLSLPAPHRTAA